VPHATTKSDVYDGYWIPKGATVYGNIEYVTASLLSMPRVHRRRSQPHSALTKDPTLFEDPETFNPSRFIFPHKPAGNWNGKVGDFTMPFGFGRRVCPGMHVALQSTFISIARYVPPGPNNRPSRFARGPPDLHVLTVGLRAAEFSGRSICSLRPMAASSILQKPGQSG
jgi:hypothetical protein